jgi:hypothetical protein
VDESKDNISRLIENMTTCLLTGIIVNEEVAPTERFQGKPALQMQKFVLPS